MPDWRRLSWADRLAWAIGTGFGSGFFPVAPGTVGSAAAGAVFYGIIYAAAYEGQLGVVLLYAFGPLTIFAALPLGIWATGRMSTDAVPDPGAAVWDEFVGMWLTCLPLALQTFYTYLLFPPYWIVLPFFLFRALDIFKPWPCRRLERLSGGWGIMLDDVAAGIWGFLAVSLVLALLAFTGYLSPSPG